MLRFVTFLATPRQVLETPATLRPESSDFVVKLPGEPAVISAVGAISFVLLAYHVSAFSDIFAEKVDASVLRFLVNPKPDVASRVSEPSLRSSLWVYLEHFNP
jgi:hypothetical protein